MGKLTAPVQSPSDPGAFLRDKIKEAEDSRRRGVYPPTTDIAKKAHRLLGELKVLGIADDIDPGGEAGGLAVFQTRSGDELPILVGYRLPVIVPDYLTLTEFGSTATIEDLPPAIQEQLEALAKKHGFEIMSFHQIQEAGFNLNEFFAKYLYY